MRLQRTLGNLTARPELSWTQKFTNFFNFNKRAYAVDLNGAFQSAIVLAPCLSGKVFRALPGSINLAHEQIAKLRALLAMNIDVAELASPFYGEVIDLGVMSRKTITDNGVTALAGAFASAAPTPLISNFKFHAFGTGTTAEAETHANLVTELTTQYLVDSTRPTGTQANTASTGGPGVATYITVGTLSPDSGGTIAVTEHGIFSAATGVGGNANTMWDRSVFSAVNLVSAAGGTGDSLQVTYTLSITANG